MKKAWMCSCGIFWLTSEKNARKHAKEAGHKITEIELSREGFKRLDELRLNLRFAQSE